MTQEFGIAAALAASGAMLHVGAMLWVIPTCRAAPRIGRVLRGVVVEPANDVLVEAEVFLVGLRRESAVEPFAEAGQEGRCPATHTLTTTPSQVHA